MRVLKPEVAQDRKEKILNWVVYNYVSTGRPVSSELIAEEGRFNVSSATVRNILKELEEGGYLYQPHTSGGRIPSDKGIRQHGHHAVYRVCRFKQAGERRASLFHNPDLPLKHDEFHGLCEQSFDGQNPHIRDTRADSRIDLHNFHDTALHNVRAVLG